MWGGTLSSPGNPSPQRPGDDGCPLGSQPPAREHWWWPFTLLLPFGALLEGWVSAGPCAHHLAILAPIKVSASSDSLYRFFGTGSSAGHTVLWCRTLVKGKMHPAGMGWRQRKGTDTAGSSRQPGQAGTAGGSAASAAAGRAVLPSLPALQGPPFCPYPTQQQNHPHAARETAGVPFPMPTGVTGSPWPPLPASPEMPASAAGRSSAPKPITGVPPMSPSSPARCSASFRGLHPMQSPTTSPALQPGPCSVPCTHRGSTPSPGGATMPCRNPRPAPGRTQLGKPIPHGKEKWKSQKPSWKFQIETQTVPSPPFPCTFGLVWLQALHFKHFQAVCLNPSWVRGFK